jgi:hypothetical protein
MNTDTGRIYEADELARREQYRNNPELLAQLEGAAQKLREQAEQREYEAAHAEGKIVPVSAHVARLMQKAQAAEKAEAVRIERRKAAKAARRKNR